MAAPLRFVTASANPGKVREITAILSDLIPDLELLPRPPEVPEVIEDGDTLQANARLKARALMHATGLPAISDDTGLFVDALDGAPGILAARYSGEHATYVSNCDKLLTELVRAGATSPLQRRARFVSVAFVAWPDSAKVRWPASELWFEGGVDGVIVDEPRGSLGFGYDPVFAPDGGGGRTFAELTASEKNAFSHRARAFRSLASELAREIATEGAWSVD